MGAMDVVQAWDRALRVGDWRAARALLTDDATYEAPDAPADERIRCTTPDQIVELFRSWKGRLPDVQVVEWETLGGHVLARLRQPAWGEDADWFQVLTVREGQIAGLEDHPTRESARAATAGVEVGHVGKGSRSEPTPQQQPQRSLSRKRRKPR